MGNRLRRSRHGRPREVFGTVCFVVLVVLPSLCSRWPDQKRAHGFSFFSLAVLRCPHVRWLVLGGCFFPALPLQNTSRQIGTAHAEHRVLRVAAFTLCGWFVMCPNETLAHVPMEARNVFHAGSETNGYAVDVCSRVAKDSVAGSVRPCSIDSTTSTN